MSPLFISPFALLLSTYGVGSSELCYIDSSTGTGVYCADNCCGDNPVYCCDKDTFIIKNAVFGSFGVFFLVVFVTCCLWRKAKRGKKKVALASTKSTLAPPASGAAGTTAVYSVPVEMRTFNQDKADPSGSETAPEEPRVSPAPYSASPAPPYEDRYNDNVYPPPSTPTHPSEVR